MTISYTKLMERRNALVQERQDLQYTINKAANRIAEIKKQIKEIDELRDKAGKYNYVANILYDRFVSMFDEGVSDTKLIEFNNYFFEIKKMKSR